MNRRVRRLKRPASTEPKCRATMELRVPAAKWVQQCAGPQDSGHQAASKSGTVSIRRTACVPAPPAAATRAAITAPVIHECLRGIVTTPCRHEARDLIREACDVRERRVTIVQQAKRHRLVQRQARDAIAVALRESQRDQPAIRVADNVDADLWCDEAVEMRRDEPHLVVQGERGRSGRRRIVAISAKVERDHATPIGKLFGEGSPLRFRTERRMQHDDRIAGADDEISGLTAGHGLRRRTNDGNRGR